MKLYRDILQEKERKKLLKFCKTKLENFGDNWPGLQSKNNLHTYPEFNLFIKTILNKHLKNYKVETAWVNYSEGDIINWHSHPTAKKSAVYFLQNPDNLGTIFRNEKYNYDKIISTKGPQNSLLVFDGSKTHSQPYSHKKIKRYTIAVDLICC